MAKSEWYGRECMDHINRKLYKNMVVVSSWVKGEAKRRCPVGETADLQKSITNEVKSESGEIVGRIGSNVVYAAIQEYGGVIRARNKPYLHFKTKDGKWHKVKSVTIPAQPYLRPAILDNKDQITTKLGGSSSTVVYR